MSSFLNLLTNRSRIPSDNFKNKPLTIKIINGRNETNYGKPYLVHTCFHSIDIYKSDIENFDINNKEIYMSKNIDSFYTSLVTNPFYKKKKNLSDLLQKYENGTDDEKKYVKDIQHYYTSLLYTGFKPENMSGNAQHILNA